MTPMERTIFPFLGGRILGQCPAASSPGKIILIKEVGPGTGTGNRNRRRQEESTQPPPKEDLLENFSGLKEEKLSRPVVDTKTL